MNNPYLQPHSLIPYTLEADTRRNGTRLLRPWVYRRNVPLLYHTHSMFSLLDVKQRELSPVNRRETVRDQK